MRELGSESTRSRLRVIDGGATIVEYDRTLEAAVRALEDLAATLPTEDILWMSLVALQRCLGRRLESRLRQRAARSVR